MDVNKSLYIANWFEKNRNLYYNATIDKDCITINHITFKLAEPTDAYQFYKVLMLKTANISNTEIWTAKLNKELMANNLSTGDVLKIITEHIITTTELPVSDIAHELKKETLSYECNNVILNEAVNFIADNKLKKIMRVSFADALRVWNIKLIKFKNIFLKELMKTKDVVIQIKFNDMYPYYPPTFFITPCFDNLINIKITSCKHFKQDNWNPISNITDIVSEIVRFIDANVTSLVQLQDEELYKVVSEYTPYIVVLPNEFDGIKLYEQTTKNIKDDEKHISIFAKGTGFGNVMTNTWDIDNYMKSKRYTQLNKEIALKEICFYISQTCLNTTDAILFETFKQTSFYNHLCEEFASLSLLEISNNHDVYTTLINLFTCLVDNNFLSIFTEDNNKLYNTLENITTQIHSLENIGNKDSIEKDITELVKKIKTHVRSKDTAEVRTNNMTKYKEVMLEYKFIDYKIIKNIDDKDVITRQFLSRFRKELSVLMNTLEVSYDASIFCVRDTENIRCMQALITGPNDTPYENGCFIFDIDLPTTYPIVPPKVTFLNNSGVRFNPNLYSDGKVCLSILGTWEGDKSESWNPVTSNLAQVLMSIQTQVFVENPFYNEPSYDIIKSKEDQKTKEEHNHIYNRNIAIYTMLYSIVGTIKNRNSYPQFKEVIEKHYKLKEERIIDRCRNWSSKYNIPTQILNDVIESINSLPSI